MFVWIYFLFFILINNILQPRVTGFQVAHLLQWIYESISTLCKFRKLSEEKNVRFNGMFKHFLRFVRHLVLNILLHLFEIMWHSRCYPSYLVIFSNMLLGNECYDKFFNCLILHVFYHTSYFVFILPWQFRRCLNYPGGTCISLQLGKRLTFFPLTLKTTWFSLEGTLATIN